MGCGRLQHLSPRLAGDIGIVEHNARAAGLPTDLSTLAKVGGERSVEIDGQRPQRAAGLVAIEPLIAIGDEPLAQRRLAGTRQAHDDHNLGVVSRRCRDRAITTQQARRGENASSSRCRSAPVSTIRSARADATAVSTRVTPGRGTITSERSPSQAMAMSNGDTPCAEAMLFNTG